MKEKLKRIVGKMGTKKSAFLENIDEVEVMEINKKGIVFFINGQEFISYG